MARTSRTDLAAQGTHAVVRALRALSHQVETRPEGYGWDLIATVDGIEVRIEIKAASVITPETVRRMLLDSDERRKDLAHLAVGDLVTAAARAALREAGWGWLDRRGHLVLRARGVHIDGVAAISWAAALLMSPEDPPAMRAVARRVSLSHSAIVAAAKKLKAASLVRADGRPLVPELFWALAEEWHPASVALAELPPAGDASTYGAPVINPDDGPGWVVAGTVGAVAWGAPLVIGSAYPPDFYAPTAADLRQATLRLGEAARFEDRACTVAVAPTPLACTERFDPPSRMLGEVRFAHGLFAALDLAQDRARGAEILEGWNPEAFTRVW
jgi:hypothetical protein